MANKISSWGIGAVSVYVMAVIALFVYATNCTGTLCGLLALMAGMPWLLLVDVLGEDSYSAGYLGWCAMALNAIFLYFLFAALQKWLSK